MAICGCSGGVFTDINVTPLTDVFLVLLVIVLLIAPTANQTVLKVNGAFGCGDFKAPIAVNVDAQGRISINGRTIGGDMLSIATALKAEQDKAGKQDIPLIVQADPDAQQKFVVSVMDAAAQSNIKQLAVVATKIR